MRVIYHNYEINIGATERRNGEIVTEACISLDFKPIHSLFVFYGQNELALEKAIVFINAI